MSVTVHCIRHGQGFHNLGDGNYELADPMMTPLGEEQCLALKIAQFSNQSHVSVIAASPLLRALHTAFIIFRPTLESGAPPNTILALPEAQETSDDPCDIGSDVTVLKGTCAANSWPVDVSRLNDGWNDKKIGSRFGPGSRAIANRARDARILLRQKGKDLVAGGNQDVHIMLIAHGGFMHYFSEDWENSYIRPGTGWVNCETRAYTFVHGINEDNSDPDAHLIETMESRRARGLEYPMFGREKQRELYLEAMQAWEDQGLQNPSKMDVHGKDSPPEVFNDLPSA